MALIDKLTAIADAIRGKTGGTAPLTLDGMATAIAGIQTGGGASGIYMAKITPAEYSAKSFTITHNLGTTDILYVALWAETLGGITPTTGTTLCKMWAKSDIVTRRGGNGFSNGYGWSVSNGYADTSAPNTASYETLRIIDGNTIELPRTQSGSGTGLCVGVTYTIIVIPTNAFAPTEV